MFTFSPINATLVSVIPRLVMLCFVVMIAAILVSVLKNALRWKRNNAAPVLTVRTQVVTKRTQVRRFRHGGAPGTLHHSSTSTTWYVTFEVESGDRLELEISGDEWGMLAENDTGRLTFQGTRYQGFQRDRS